MESPFDASQIRIIGSIPGNMEAASPLVVTKYRPSGLKNKLVTHDPWLIVLVAGPASTVRQSRTVPSSVAVTNFFPSGEKPRHWMVCDTFGVAASTLPAALDHNRTILSVELVRTVPPSGLMQHAEMFFSCGKETPFQEWSTALRTKTCVPHASAHRLP